MCVFCRGGRLVPGQELGQLADSGAAKITIGNIISQARSHDCTQCGTNEPAPGTEAVAIAAAMAQVRQDWMTP